MSDESVLLSLDGMTCQGCVARVEKILSRAGLSESAAVSVGSVRLPGHAASEAAAAIDALQKAGYHVQVQE